LLFDYITIALIYFSYFFKRNKKCVVVLSTVFYESRNRPGVAQRVPGGLVSQIFMTFGT